MKISIITPTFNRAYTIKKLYNSLLENKKTFENFEWIVIDDGSNDNTKDIIQEFIVENKLDIKYSYQKNKGKMAAINRGIELVTGDLIVDCDSDDYFVNNAFEIIEFNFKKHEKEIYFEKIYAFGYLKYDQNESNIGNNFENQKSKMFDVYFKENETGEKALVFITNIRKKYMHKIEKNEKFVPESRLYHEMDQNYSVICINKPIMICEYKEDGYTNNSMELFVKYPYGYLKYFVELLKFDFKGVKFKKRMYAIKHLILFSHITKQRIDIKSIKGVINKILIILLIIPGKIKSRKIINSKEVLSEKKEKK